jgi:hypothetical protein
MRLRLIDFTIMPLIWKMESDLRGVPSTLSEQKSFRSLKIIFRRCSILKRSVVACHPQVHPYSSFQTHTEEAYDCMWITEVYIVWWL